jgi:hypothetical protein
MNKVQIQATYSFFKIQFTTVNQSVSFEKQKNTESNFRDLPV